MEDSVDKSPTKSVDYGALSDTAYIRVIEEETTPSAENAFTAVACRLCKTTLMLFSRLVSMLEKSAEDSDSLATSIRYSNMLLFHWAIEAGVCSGRLDGYLRHGRLDRVVALVGMLAVTKSLQKCKLIVLISRESAIFAYRLVAADLRPSRYNQTHGACHSKADYS